MAMTDSSTVGKILEEHKKSGEENLITILEELQGTYGYLPSEVLETVAVETGRSPAEVYGLASFYKSFSFEPRGRHVVSVCMGTACHVRGAATVLEEFQTHLNVQPGQTTGDKEFTLETVNCLGACALGPVAVTDGTYRRKLSRAKVKGIIKEVREGKDVVVLSEDQRVFYVEAQCPHCERSLMDPGTPIDEHPSIELAVSVDHRNGSLHLSGLYGSRNIETSIELPEGVIAEFSCPKCNRALNGASLCAICTAPNISLKMVVGGALLVCSRRGCEGHLLDLDGTYLL